MNKNKIINILLSFFAFDTYSMDINKKLLKAAQENKINLVQELLDAGANINALDDELEHTPLILAVSFNYEDIIKLLINRGADINAGNKRKVTPIYYALHRNNLPLVKLLKDSGAEVDLNIALHNAVLMGYFKLAKYLILSGANVNFKSAFDETPIFQAFNTVEKNRSTCIKLVKLLLKHKANVNVKQSFFDETILHKAVQKGQSEIVRLLLANGAIVNANQRNLWTPLHFAADNNNKDIVRILLENGANKNMLNYPRYKKPEDLATVKEIKNLIKNFNYDEYKAFRVRPLVKQVIDCINKNIESFNQENLKLTLPNEVLEQIIFN